MFWARGISEGLYCSFPERLAEQILIVLLRELFISRVALPPTSKCVWWDTIKWDMVHNAVHVLLVHYSWHRGDKVKRQLQNHLRCIYSNRDRESGALTVGDPLIDTCNPLRASPARFQGPLEKSLKSCICIVKLLFCIWDFFTTN